MTDNLKKRAIMIGKVVNMIKSGYSDKEIQQVVNIDDASLAKLKEDLKK